MEVHGRAICSTAPVLVLAAAGLVACAPAGKETAAGATPLAAVAPARRAGLWEQTIVRDGKGVPGHGVRVCLDAVRDGHLWMFGDGAASAHCNRDIRRDPAGAYHFASTCKVGDQVVVSSTGVATGDFASAYEVRSVMTVRGAPLAELDGRHDLHLVAHYRGACPAGVEPGQVVVGRGLKVDSRRLPQLARAFIGA